ncbi:addiction module antitoxin [Celeribacter ethanolicus]|uniref:Addiction module antitoxin n=1 Tax=Celeribacter ethanolicus TaxID=1758178 RepID=A0A291GAN0_9RHOB|nr:type II toxin-antitoxin system ParD family antitoxin [Celeribacter ethanolicus]ATG47251.1 addiction module antitoxin [Celeribacter ethanolicus]
MATMNVSLPDGMKSWVEDQSTTGSFANASDYVRHLIRKDQERQSAIAMLQGAITEGLESGPAEPFEMSGFKASLKARHDE